jgi:hypothetical protein
MLIYKYKKDSDAAYILHLKKNISRNKFLLMMKVTPSSFAEKLLKRIYDNFFSEVIDLYQEYKKYHRKEYTDFGLFLRKKYNLPSKIVTKGLDMVNSSKNSSLFFKREYTSGDYNVETFIMSEDGCNTLLANILGGNK